MKTIAFHKISRPTSSIVRFIQKLYTQCLYECDFTHEEMWIRDMIDFNIAYLLQYKGKSIGAVTAFKDRGSLAIETLAIAKHYQRKGIGSKTIHFMEQVAKKNKLRKVCVGSMCTYHARKFYEKMGFKVTGKFNNGDGDYWEFEKKIA